MKIELSKVGKEQVMLLIITYFNACAKIQLCDANILDGWMG